MFRTVLIANRGEIACRVIRAAKALGIRSVAMHPPEDRGALFVRRADEAHELAGGYLDAPGIVALAKSVGADCLHPGYGFLAENPEFAELCATAGVAFIGPSPVAMRALGLKHTAKILAQKAAVPVLPGYSGDNQTPKFLKEKAYEIGYPVLIKAVAGGGGRGMRKVDAHAAFEDALEAAKREASAAFGDARVLIEKYVASPRHVEVQIFGDGQGNVVHLFERDCSAQRRHQKIVEEAPAPRLSPAVRSGLAEAAVAVARAARYANAGTVEFVVDPATEAFYFLELNARLQVEHPVTEAITGVDLVAWQFRVAAGEPLPVRQDQIRVHGHAIEARVCAEDPENGFLPSPGRVVALRWPEGGVRVEAGVEAGDRVSARYDSLIAKVIARGDTREAALSNLRAALAATRVAGPKTNLAFLDALLSSDAFREGRMTTTTVDADLVALGAKPQPLDESAALAGAAALRRAERERWRRPASRDPWDVADDFDLMGRQAVGFEARVEGKRENFADRRGIVSFADGRAVAPTTDATVIEDGEGAFVLRRGRQTRVEPLVYEDAIEAAGAEGAAAVHAPMHGRIVALTVDEGASVEEGQRLGALEAMKMEHALHAPRTGRVTHVAVKVGDLVEQGTELMRVEGAEEP